MKKRVLLYAVLTAGVVSAAPQPVYFWNFNRKINADYTESSNTTGKKLWLKAALRKNAGIKKSSALDCNLKSYNYAAALKMPWKEFTVDFRFKLDNPVNEKNGNTFMWYSVHSWGRSDFLFKITPKKELMAQFFTKDDNTGKILLNYTVTTKPLDIQAGKFYSVRLATVSGGSLKIWFDGVLTGARDRAVSFSDLTPGKERYYPLLIIGGESRTAKPRFQLDGVIDDFAIYNKALDSAPATAVDKSSADAFVPLTIPAKSTSCKFNVLDVDVQGGVVFTQADKVFRDNAARASIEVSGENMVITFDCPVSAAHPVDKKPESYWSGELVEFFWSNDLNKGYYQFIYSASNGKTVANSWSSNGSRRTDWKTSFTAQYSDTPEGFQVKMAIPCKDIGFDPASEQKIYRANFTRSGKSAGGRSSWANVGQDFHNYNGFGIIVKGTLADYFTIKLDELLGRNKDLKLSASIQKKVDLFRTEIASKGNAKSNCGILERQLANLENDLVMEMLSGKKLLISRPDMWRDDITPGMMTRPVKKFKLRMAQNTVTFLPFAVSNMTDKRFLCQVKCMDKLPPEKFNNYPDAPFPIAAGFREAIPHDANDGRSFYDALADLPMGQILRVHAKDTAALWLTLDSRGIKPGTYKTSIVFKSATAGFDNEIIPLEIEVLPVDLGKIQIDTALYNYIQARFVNTRKVPKDELLKLLVEREVNYLFCNVPGDRDMEIYPPLDANGNPGKCDFTHLDNNIDSYIKAGMKLERMKLWFYLAMDYPGYVLTLRGKHCTLKEFSPQWETALKSFFTQLFAHLKKKYDIAPDRVVFCVVDEPRGDYNDPKSTTYRACQYAKMLRRIAPEARLMANPYDLKDDAVTRNNLSKLAECFDIIQPYSGQLTPDLVKFLKGLKFREYWTYNIKQKIHTPDSYCLKIWENMANGFSTMSPYWHVDQADGGDALCAFDVDSNYGVRRNDYASIFCDFTSGRGIVSRRQEAFYLGGQDAKLIILCRKLAEGRAEAAQVEALVKKGAAGDMQIIAECREKLLDIALKLGK
ncbi:MAG: hypothetical protein J6W00_04405 [Lentisphaeria bacterium]|nr:hypothetical protein [Lentisphaeria bacterium]